MPHLPLSTAVHTAPAAPPALTVRALLLALLLTASASADVTTTRCDALRNEASSAPSPARTARVSLVWSSETVRAAAALLRAVLLAAGYAPDHVTLRRLPPRHDLCALLADAHLPPPPPPEGSPEETLAAAEVVVGVAVPWWGGERARCGWSSQRLRVLGTGAAPLAPRLHARLASDAPRDRCSDSTLLRSDDTLVLSTCRFLPPAPAPGSKDSAILYVPQDEWEEEAAALHAAAPWRVQAVSRAELARLVHGPRDTSFLVLDAELWHTDEAHPLEPPSRAPHSLLVVDEYALLARAPALFMLLNRSDDVSFLPDASDLRAVLELSSDLGVEEAACKRAPLASRFNEWRNLVKRKKNRHAVAVLCKDEKARSELETTVNSLVPEYVSVDATRLGELGARLAMRHEFVDCGDPSALVERISAWRTSGEVWSMVGVVAPAEQARVAAPVADGERLPLVAYTPAEAPARAATGRSEHLMQALRRLLGACRWLRAGVIAGGEPRAEKDARALAGPLVRVASERVPAAAVHELHALDTRVFLLLGSPQTVQRALEEAHKLRLTPERGFAWIVTEFATIFDSKYAASQDVTEALRPLSLSFQYRGTGAGAGSSLLTTLEERWELRAWPPHLASIADALITLGVGYARLVEKFNETLDYPDARKTVSRFWEVVRSSKIQGVVEDLEYDDRGVTSSSVYVEQWTNSNGTETRPRRLATWRVGEQAPPHERCPLPDAPSDGRSTCLTRAGDPYHPRCYDTACAGAAVALALALLAAAGAALAVRRWLARHDRRLERAATVRVLAQREAAFAELEPYLVERAALLLGEELGAGRFGRVRCGEVRSTRRRASLVAVKALRDGASPAEESQFLREARTLAALRHDHVVSFVGVCWEGGPPLLLMELAFFGDLLRYLRTRRHLAENAAEGTVEADGEAAHVGPAALTRLAREAAEALAYLAARGLVHRDVRAANCLVDARRSLKLADFGLARETSAEEGEYACRGRALFPVLWMAPESLARGVASPASDAWSFGVLVLELVTLGARPFGAATPASAVRLVLAGGRPPLPRDACAETRALALACWRRAPSLRPAATRLAAWLAHRPTALRPALASDLQEPDCDSGIGDGQPEALTDLLAA